MTVARWPFTVGEHGFPIDPTNEEFRGPSSVALLRAQADTSGRPGEASLNREDYWRRTITSWHHGAGQRVHDGEDSDPYRFWASRGLDVWTKGQLSLLPKTEFFMQSQAMRKVMVTSFGTIEYLWVLGIDSGTTIYVHDHLISSATGYPESAADFTSVTTGSPMLDLATDGAYIYATDGTDVYRDLAYSIVASGGFPASPYNTLSCERLWFLRNRLIATNGRSIYNITSGTEPTAHYTHPVEGWDWTGAAEANGYIYMSGRSGYTSMIYKIGIDETTATAELDQPASAVQWNDGTEYIESIYSTSGLILIGTSMGVRLATPDASGFLTYGPLLPIGNTSAFIAEGSYVWAGTHSRQEAGNIQTKLWRLNLDEFTEPLAPAYAEDLVSLGDDDNLYPDLTVSSIARYGGRTYYTQQYLAVADTLSEHNRLYRGSDEMQDFGQMITGEITYGIPDSKRLLLVEVRSHPLPGVPEQVLYPTLLEQVVVMTSENYGTVTALEPVAPPEEDGTYSSFDGGDAAFDVESVTLYIRPPDTDLTESPVVTSLTVRSRPTPARANVYVVPVRIGDEGLDLRNYNRQRDPAADIDFFVQWTRGGDGRECTLLGRNFTSYCEDYQFVPDGMSESDQHFSGTLMVKLRELL